MKKVLLVNDSKFESLIMKDMLSTIGYDVKVSDEFNAINQLEAFKPDLFISNYIMKEIRGDQLISKIRVKSPNTKCFLCSSNSSAEETVKNKGIDGFIKTPIDRVILEKVLTDKNGGECYVYSAQSKQSSGTGANSRTYCASCLQEIKKPGEKQFAFCPFCGHRL